MEDQSSRRSEPANQRAAALFEQMRAGDSSAAASLVPLVYAELRGLAASCLHRERPGHTLQPTALVHEAFLRLTRAPSDAYADRAHFMAVAANAMRQILVDYARARGAKKRGGDRERQTMAGIGEDAATAIDVLDLEAALTGLAVLHPRPARVAELRLFAGLEIEDVSQLLQVSASTIKSDWRFARAWLRRTLEQDSAP